MVLLWTFKFIVMEDSSKSWGLSRPLTWTLGQIRAAVKWTEGIRIKGEGFQRYKRKIRAFISANKQWGFVKFRILLCDASKTRAFFLLSGEVLAAGPFAQEVKPLIQWDAECVVWLMHTSLLDVSERKGFDTWLSNLEWSSNPNPPKNNPGWTRQRSKPRFIVCPLKMNGQYILLTYSLHTCLALWLLFPLLLSSFCLEQKLQAAPTINRGEYFLGRKCY